MEPKLVLMLLFFGVSVFFLGSMFIPGSFAQTLVMDILEFVQTLPKAVGAVVLSLTYGLAVSFMLPGTPFNLGAGYLFGFTIGAPVAVCGALLGANGAFLMGRYFVREWAETTMNSDRRFRAIDRAIKKGGTYLVALLRVSPVMPFPVLSYVFGVTQISWADHCLGTLLGLLPATVIESYVGQEMQGLSEALEHKESSLSWLIIVGVVTLICLGLVSYMSHQALKSALAEEEATEKDLPALPSHSKRPS